MPFTPCLIRTLYCRKKINLFPKEGRKEGEHFSRIHFQSFVEGMPVCMPALCKILVSGELFL